MSVEELSRGGLARCNVRELGGGVVLWGEDFPFLYFFLFGWESFSDEWG